MILKCALQILEYMYCMGLPTEDILRHRVFVRSTDSMGYTDKKNKMTMIDKSPKRNFSVTSMARCPLASEDANFQNFLLGIQTLWLNYR